MVKLLNAKSRDYGVSRDSERLFSTAPLRPSSGTDGQSGMLIVISWLPSFITLGVHGDQERKASSVDSAGTVGIAQVYAFICLMRTRFSTTTLYKGRRA